MEITLSGQKIQLDPSGALYWVEACTLFLADVHIGKAAHFSKWGLAVPQEVEESNLRRLSLAIDTYKPERVIFLGDLFHSQYNKAWSTFVRWRSGYTDIPFELILGNHDILAADRYAEAGIICTSGLRIFSPFILQHEPLEEALEQGYGLCGHLHPGVRLRGGGKQILRLPCFYFGKRQGILPAFGGFTGLHLITPEPESRVFVLADGQVYAV